MGVSRLTEAGVSEEIRRSIRRFTDVPTLEFVSNLERILLTERAHPEASMDILILVYVGYLRHTCRHSCSEQNSDTFPANVPRKSYKRSLSCYLLLCYSQRRTLGSAT